MNKIITLLLAILFSQVLNAQTVKETKITGNIGQDVNSLYDFKYDRNSGTYVYSNYDTITMKYTVISNKGNSAIYNYANTYDIVFDNDGNYYASVSNNITDTTYIYYLLKNGKEIRSFSNITFPVQKWNDGIYFIAKENGKDYRGKYNFKSGEFEFGKGYDTIYTCYVDAGKNNPEPVTEIGFTKDGLDFFIACEGGKQMLVIGNREMKKYDEIIYRNVFKDNSGNICYVAKEITNGRGLLLLVQGDKEYNKFTDISSYEVVFDKNDIPYYAASDEVAEYPSTQFLVKGNEAISKKFTRGLYGITFSVSGNIAFCGSDSLKDGKNITRLYINGKESAKYPSIYGVKFREDNSFVFTATDKDDKSFVVDGDKVISGKYNNITDLALNKKGVVSYIATNFGDYDKNTPDETYYFIGNEKYGPYSNLLQGEMGPPPVIFNDNGDYVLTVSKSINLNGELKTINYILHKKWVSIQYDYITDVNAYKNDFYYAGNNYFDVGTSVYQLFKNKKPIGEEYSIVTEFKLDKEKGIITFNGMRNSIIYSVEIYLND